MSFLKLFKGAFVSPDWGGGITRFLSKNPQETIYFIDPGRDGGKPPWPPLCSVYAAGVN